MTAKQLFRRVARRFGYDILSFQPAFNQAARIQQLLAPSSTDVVLDVGANTGQYAQFLRTEMSYVGQIVSFEPLSSAFGTLSSKAAGDPKWAVVNSALGDADSDGQINIAGNSYSSSLLEMLPAHVQSAPESSYQGTERISIKKLDSILAQYCMPADRIYMKIDTQGFEGRVLAGAEASLQRIHSVQLEMSLVPLYQGELSFTGLCEYMQARGFVLIALLPGFADRTTGQLLQVDGVFHRPERTV